MSTDAIVMLRDDHKEIRKLIRACRAAADGQDRPAGADTGGTADTADTGGGTPAAEAVKELLHLLSVHTYLEDEVMYPRARRLVPETGGTVLRFHEEHHVADVLAGELEAMDSRDEGYAAKAAVLMDAVERHMKAEEEGWFPQVRAAVGRKELQAIGARMAELRELAPQRPRRTLLRKVADALSAA
ncbi:hemerythrin domain-containing protein [Streptomyces sp. NPDC086023]|uniref:hemerythrin domain-containing protein n=1 Tax=Streptomyces sp. NPDC086023 TaxID=3365746 RepID=UPI0037D11CB0